MKNAMLPAAMVAFLMLAGCNKSHSVEDFRKDESLRAEYLAKCDKGELKDDAQTCENARKAQEEATAAPEAPAVAQ